MSESPLARWRGRTALVTGASSGIGRTIATDFGRLGLNVALTGRRRAELEDTARAVRDAGGAALVVVCDHAIAAENAAAFAQARARWGGIDIVVNNAGVRGGTCLLGTTLGEIERAFTVNVISAVACMQEAVADLRARGAAGVIINLSSMTGHRVLPGTPAVYAATKHALRIVTDGMRSEVAMERLPIKVALISPGMVDTPWHRQPDGIIARSGASPHPPLQPHDLVEAVRYILAAPPHVQICDIQVRSTGQIN